MILRTETLLLRQSFAMNRFDCSYRISFVYGRRDLYIVTVDMEF